MHFGRVLRVVAVLLVIVCFFMLFPILFALYYGEGDMIRHFLIPMGGVLVVALVAFATGKGGPHVLSTRDGFLLVSLSWISASLVGALPLYLSGTIPRYVDAYFETMSGFTTTGASILTRIEGLPKSMLFWRSLTHWLGGMGIVVLTVAVFPLLGFGAYQLMKAEAPGPSLDRLTPRIASTAKILWLIYLGMTIAETALLMFGGMDLFDALTHTFGTLATGGFSPKNTSVGFYQSPFVHNVITVFMVLAGMNFVMHYRLLTLDLRRVFRNVELRVYLAIFLVAMVLIAWDLFGHGAYSTFGESLRFAGFQAASILTTTGFVTTDYARWPLFAQVVLFVLMFIGGCSGSTGGGIKVIRIVTLFKQGLNEMRYLAYPHSVFSMKMEGARIKKDVVYAISGFFFLYMLMLIVTTLVVAAGGNDVVTSISSALVTVGNIGPGFGRVGPTENYAFYQPVIKWFLSFAMMVGRLEVYTVLVLLTPRYWKG
jgi:trk system potassium uptake protein TrkH